MISLRLIMIAFYLITFSTVCAGGLESGFLNETIRIMIRTFMPFVILIVISLLTRRDDKEMLDRFYVKMKTQVHTDPDEDTRQMELSYADPSRFDHRKLLPKSDWEFDKWDKTDTIGFAISTAVAVVVVFFLIGLISLGK